MNARSVYVHPDHPGLPLRYVGQAAFHDEHGALVEHDWVRMRIVGDDDTGAEVWVDPTECTALTARQAARMPRVA